MDPAFPRTHSIAALRLCSGLAANGHRVELVVPQVAIPAPSAEALFRTYELDRSFDVRYVPVGGRKGEYDRWTLRRLVMRHVARALRTSGKTVVISDGIRLMLPYVAAARIRSRLVTAPWLHEFRGARLERLACAHGACVLATNRAILSDMANDGVSNTRTFVTGNPVPRERVEFGRAFSKDEARRRLELDQRRPVVTYTGKLYLGMRELDYYLEAAALLPEFLFLFTGGRPRVIAALHEKLRERGIENVRLAGMLDEPEETRFYQQAADVLVTYYSTEDLPYAHHHIPSKLAEYMTTGNPIVAADYPAVRDLLSPENAILVPPHEVPALTAAIEFAVRRRAEADRLAARAQQDIAGRTSESVAAELGAFLLATGHGLE